MPASQQSPRLTAFYYLAWLAAVCALLVLFVIGGMKSPAPDAVQKTPPQAGASTPQPVPYQPVTAIPPFDTDHAEHILLAWSTQGMQMVTDAEPRWSLLPPGNELRAQLIRRGPQPGLVTENVRLTWRVEKEHATRDGAPVAGAEGTMRLDEGGSTFSADGIEILPYRASGGFNAYPTVMVEAHDATGRLLGRTAAVLPVSTEVGCRNCHGGPWKRDGLAGIDATTADDVLAVHDRINGTDLQSAATKAPVVCRSCHSGAPEGAGPSLSAALHGWHANYMTGGGAETCANCHPAAPQGATRFMRGLHNAKALDCTRCHGTMEDHAIALLRWEEKAGRKGMERMAKGLTPRAVASAEAINPRAPWAMQPDCTGCHDFMSKPASATASAFNKWTASEKDRFSARVDDMGNLRCPTCHGAPHAEYPAVNPFGRDLDNMPPVQYQQHATVMGGGNNCVVCHREPLPMEASAHHPVVLRKTIAITLPVGASPTKPVVLFPHEAHGEVDCGTCHHKGYQDGKQTCATKGCHDKPRPDTVEGLGEAAYYRNAFHGKERGCMTCHLALRAEGKAAGPTGCRDCHTPGNNQ